MNAMPHPLQMIQPSEPAAAPRPHQGMPPMEQDGPPISFFEFWPMWAFYPPVMAYVAWLMLRHRGTLLPTVANPSFPGGGFYGESKAEILALAMQHVPEWTAPFVRRERPTDAAAQTASTECESALAALQQAGIALPVVAKPDLGCRGAGVKLIRSAADLTRYIQAFPAGATYLLQQLVPFEGEAGIFYCRRPGQAQGRVISITLKYFPHVIGDGRRTVPGSVHQNPHGGIAVQRLDQIGYRPKRCGLVMSRPVHARHRLDGVVVGCCFVEKQWPRKGTTTLICFGIRSLPSHVL